MPKPDRDFKRLMRVRFRMGRAGALRRHLSGARNSLDRSLLQRALDRQAQRVRPNMEQEPKRPTLDDGSTFTSINWQNLSPQEWEKREAELRESLRHRNQGEMF
jgi:hypothetical protein